jgi:hypothetical protein
MNWTRLTVVTLVVLLLVPGFGFAAVAGSPGITASLIDGTVNPDDDTTLSVKLVNDATVTSADVSASYATLRSRVTTARGVTVTLGTDNGDVPISIDNTQQSFGSLSDGASTTVDFDVNVDASASPGTYEVPVYVEYSYTDYISEVDGNHDRTTVNRTRDVTLKIEEDASFEVVAVESGTRVGSTGTVDVTLRNTGTAPANDTSLTLSSQNSDLTFGQSSSASRFVGDWPTGENRTVEYRVTTANSASSQSYAFTATADYEDADGESHTSDNLSLSVVPDEQQQLGVVSTDADVSVGDTGTVNVTLRNDGPQGMNATSVTLTSTNGDMTIGGSSSGSRFVGDWPAGENRTVEYRVSAANSASTQSYAFDVSATYEDDNDDTHSTETTSLSVVPRAEQQFSVVSTDTDVAVDDSGTVNVTLRNDGPRAVDDATVTFTSNNADITFGQSSTASRYVGSWAAGESHSVEVDTTAASGADVSNYAIDTTVSYEGTDDNEKSSAELSVGLTPEPEQSFDASDLASNLTVGDEGTITGTLENTGDTTANSVVVVFETDTQNVDPLDTEYSIGDLEPGESANFSFDVEVSESAESGPKQFSLRPEYRNSENEQRTADSFVTRQEIRPERDTFNLTTSNATLSTGSAAAFTIDVTNTGDKTVRDVSAKMFADSPISVDDSEAFVSKLEPGETKTIVFEISAAGSAIPKSYPVSVDFQYDEPDGDTVLSDTYRLPVTVTEPEGGSGGPPILLVVGLVVVVAVVAGAVYTRVYR